MFVGVLVDNGVVSGVLVGVGVLLLVGVFVFVIDGVGVFVNGINVTIMSHPAVGV